MLRLNSFGTNTCETAAKPRTNKELLNKKDDRKFTIEIFWILKPILFLKLFCMNILSINPKVLPSKIILIELKSKIYIFIQPFKILLGSSKNLLEANSTLTQVSFLLTFQLRNTDKVVPTSRTNNSLA